MKTTVIENKLEGLFFYGNDSPEREKCCMFSKYVRDLKEEFAGYHAREFAKDMMAGLTVAAVALPLALAFGVSSGATAASGLLTAIIGGFVICLLGGAFYQISGPTGAMAAILMSIVAQYGMSGVFEATLMAGILLVIAGIFHLGRLTAFIPMPVITGFTSGISVIIALGQLDHFFGVSSEGGSAVEKVISYFASGFSPDWITVLIGTLVILFMVFYPKKWNNIVPASLLAIILATAASVFFSLDVETVGAIPTTLLLEDRLTFSGLRLSEMRNLFIPAVSIATLGMVESLLCGASAGRMTGVPLDNDRELVAQGIGNILVPFFGGIPATAAIARTSVAIKSGAKTRVAGLVHAVGLLISMLLLAPVMARIPLSALAGVLMVTAWRMNEWDTIRYLFSRKFKGAILKFSVTMLATVLFDLTVAIVIGVVIAFILLAARQSNLEIHYDEVHASRMHRPQDMLEERSENAAVAYIGGAILFSNVQMLEEMKNRLEPYETVFLSMRGVSYLDISGAQALLEMLRQLRASEKQIFICGLSESVEQMMIRSGIMEYVGEDHFYWSVEKALIGA